MKKRDKDLNVTIVFENNSFKTKYMIFSIISFVMSIGFFIFGIYFQSLIKTGICFMSSGVFLIQFFNYMNTVSCYAYQENILQYYGLINMMISCILNIDKDIKLYENFSMDEVKKSMKYLKRFSDYNICKIYKNCDYLNIKAETDFKDFKKSIFNSNLLNLVSFILIIFLYLMIMKCNGTLWIIPKIICIISIIVSEIFLGYSDSVYKFVYNMREDDIKEFQDTRKLSNNVTEIESCEKIFTDLKIIYLNRVCQQEFQKKLKDFQTEKMEKTHNSYEGV